MRHKISKTKCTEVLRELFWIHHVHAKSTMLCYKQYFAEGHNSERYPLIYMYHAKVHVCFIMVTFVEKATNDTHHSRLQQKGNQLIQRK